MSAVYICKYSLRKKFPIKQTVTYNLEWSEMHIMIAYTVPGIES